MPSAKKRRAMEHERRKKQYQLWGTVLGIVAVIAIVAVVVSQSQGGSGTDGAAQTRPVTVEGDALPPVPTDGSPDPALGTPGPTLAGQSFDGTPVTIDPGASGNPTAIWIVAHWCPHCNAEVPRVVSLNDQGTLPAGIDYYAISSGVDPNQVNYPPSTWLQRERWPFPALADDENGTAAKAYGLTSYPLLIVLDADGNVVARHAGELGEAGITQVLQQVASG
jgi:cytochrome c biogenesis protein CcmG/thiol:disulfide interchange protein DsbE